MPIIFDQKFASHPLLPVTYFLLTWLELEKRRPNHDFSLVSTPAYINLWRGMRSCDLGPWGDLVAYLEPIVVVDVARMLKKES